MNQQNNKWIGSSTLSQIVLPHFGVKLVSSKKIMWFTALSLYHTLDNGVKITAFQVGPNLTMWQISTWYVKGT